MTNTIQGYPYDFTTNLRYSPVYNQQIQQRTLIIPGGGCAYYRAKKGDVCPFCAFPDFSRYVIKGAGHEKDFSPWTLSADIYQQMYNSAVSAPGEFQKLAVFNGGSFFPSPEIPATTQRYIYENVAKRDNIRQLMVEAYPSYIAKSKLIEARAILGTTDLMVAVGFESISDKVRNSYLKKRIDLALFEKKVAMMQDLGVQVFIYAFLKAPQLSERQAIDEALATLEYLHNLGVDEIALSCAFVPPGTALETQYNNGEFRPPWLWSIVEIMQQARLYGWPLSIGGFEDTPPPVAGPNNCPDCDKQVNEFIAGYRLLGETPLVQPSCHCRHEWRETLQQDPTQSISIVARNIT